MRVFWSVVILIPPLVACVFDHELGIGGQSLCWGERQAGRQDLRSPSQCWLRGRKSGGKPRLPAGHKGQKGRRPWARGLLPPVTPEMEP